jgi:hypothetical protein
VGQLFLQDGENAQLLEKEGFENALDERLGHSG